MLADSQTNASETHSIPIDSSFEKGNNSAVFFDIKFNDGLKDEIKKNISKLFMGCEIGFDLILNKYNRLLADKTTKEKMGLLSEFITHIILVSYGYEQHFLFANLEENSAKKGFDGLYTFDENIWLMESKSGSAKTKHKGKIKLAINDLENKLSNNTDNNPWQNAYTHSMMVNQNIQLKSMLLDLDKMYEKKKPIDKNQFCIIPSATIFSDPTIILSKEDLETIIVDNEYLKALFLCISQRKIEETESYIRGVLSDEIHIENNAQE